MTTSSSSLGRNFKEEQSPSPSCQIIMKCTNIRENTRLHKGYAEPRLRETQWVLHRRKPLLRGRDDEAGVNTVCIGKDLSMQGPIRVHAYCGGKGGERKDRAVWRFAPKGNGMR